MGKKRAGRSFMAKVLLPVAALLVLQTVLFTAAILWGGTIGELNQNAMDILGERVINRKNYMQNDMLLRWSNFTSSHEVIGEAVRGVLAEEGADYGDLVSGSPLAARALDAISQELIYLLRKNSVTGVYVILQGDTGTGTPQTGEVQAKAGLYLRDMEPTFAASDDSDVLIERSPISVSKTLDIPMDIYWSPQFQLKADDLYYYAPLIAALAYPGESAKDMGYWGGPFTMSENDMRVMTYSEPLLGDDGKPYGVIGFEMSVDHLRTLLPYAELEADKAAAYVLAVGRQTAEGALEFTYIFSSGPTFAHLFGEPSSIHLDAEPLYGSVYRAQKNERMQQDVLASVNYFDIYNSNTPFANERWALLGVAEEDTLFQFSQTMTETILIVMGIMLLVGLVGAWITGFGLTRPIVALAHKVQTSDPHKPVKLAKTHVLEIDQLSSAIEQLSQSVAQASSKLSQVIEMAGIPIGAFEYKAETNNVYCTRSFFRLMGRIVENNEESLPSVSHEEFAQWLSALQEHAEVSYEVGGACVYEVEQEVADEKRWMRLKIVRQDEMTFGVLVDVTQEMVEKRKIEYERDYDLLTNLLNRRAFHVYAEKVFQMPDKLCISALLMTDLDNLKYINDTYGHDSGDEYIRCAATALRRVASDHILAARMSGDEFYVLFHGYPDKATAQRDIDRLRRSMLESTLTLPDGEQVRVRASAGIAWYPDHSRSLDELIRYADFAMYQVKNTNKGSQQDFDLESYQRDSFMLQSKEELNRIIEDELVDYAFQPIVSARDGSIFAYEALMRPRTDVLTIPLDVLRLARSQAMLYQIERLTWFKAMEMYSTHAAQLKDCRIFINSISNQQLGEEDVILFDRQFEKYLDRIVIEITEGETMDELLMAQKKKRCQRYNASIALDDFGAGFNGEVALLRLLPDYIKIDIDIIHGIDQDPNRQDIFKNLVSFSRQRNIRVVAEGVETEAEMRVLVQCGVDYMQGFFFGKGELTPQPIRADAVEALQRVWEEMDERQV